MAQLFKLVSLLFVVALAAISIPAAAAAPTKQVGPKGAPAISQALIKEGPVRTPRADGFSEARWTSLETAYQNEVAAAQAVAEAQRQADLAAQQAAEQARAQAIGAAIPPAAAPAAPAVAAPPPSHYSGNIQELIQSIFSSQGQAAVDWAERVAKCESGYNPNAYNSSSGASGLFQFLPSTWRNTPYASRSPFDADANTRAAAWLYAQDHGSAWSCR